MKNLSKAYGYSYYKYKKVFSEFILANKNAPFFDRLRSLLFYREKIVSPYGDLSLFVKAERIKLAYLCLSEFIRVENL